MSFIVAPIVEGHGDVAALPVLLRLIEPTLFIKRPVRFPRSRLLIDEHLGRAARIAAANIQEAGAVLLVLDADHDCAATLGPDLERRLSAFLPNVICRVVIPVGEFESWIVGGNLEFNVSDPDRAGHLKSRIRERFGVYSETVDQPRLISRADLAILEARSRSFQRLKKVIAEFSQIAAGIHETE